MRKTKTINLGRVLVVLWFCVAVMICVILAGCSAVQQLNTNASKIDKLSQSSENRFVKISDMSDAFEIGIQTEKGIEEQQAIQDSVANIREALPRVEDKLPFWASVLDRVAVAGIVIAIAYILWNTGIGTLLKRLIYSFSWFIPRRSTRDASMDRKIADSEDTMSIREAVAAKRASDPAYDAAYRKLKD